MQKQRISILGSTWSIWTQTLDVIRKFPEYFEVYALAVNSNIELLKKQIKEFNPAKVVVFDEKKAKELRINCHPDIYQNPNKKFLNSASAQEWQKCFTTEVLSWMQWLIEIAEYESVDIIVASMVWAIWLEPTKAALKKWKIVAYANKETIAVAGEEMKKLEKKYWWEIRPVDSELSAIWQCLRSWEKKEIKKVWLTASGWPFRDASLWPKEKIASAKASDALKHPTWDMWTKISIDSATLANKWLEFIEMKYLFDLKPEQIEVVVHPQSLIHSAIEFVDWSVIAELWATDMRRAIAYSLFWQSRMPNSFKSFSFFDKSLTFEKPDLERFPCLWLAIQSAKHSQEACAIFNNTNEKAVELYLKWEIWFYNISAMIEKELNQIGL